MTADDVWQPLDAFLQEEDGFFGGYKAVQIFVFLLLNYQFQFHVNEYLMILTKYRLAFHTK